MSKRLLKLKYYLLIWYRWGNFLGLCGYSETTHGIIWNGKMISLVTSATKETSTILWKACAFAWQPRRNKVTAKYNRDREPCTLFLFYFAPHTIQALFLADIPFLVRCACEAARTYRLQQQYNQRSL